MGSVMIGSEEIHRLAKERGCRLDELLAMSKVCDPFFADIPYKRQKAEWFLDLWRRFGYGKGVHTRRIHYQIVSQREPVELPTELTWKDKVTGETRRTSVYVNTVRCWMYLNEATKAARELGMIPADALEDHKNPPPHMFAAGYLERDDPEWRPGELTWHLPYVSVNVRSDCSAWITDPDVSGYGYRRADQPYWIEVWVEKSTQDDVLLPVCQELGVNLVTSEGFQSISNVVEVLQRVKVSGKPARIFYISDFDPAGDCMPLQVSRQLEFWLPQFAPGAEVKLTPLALTLDQVRHYQLPRSPVKDTDTRKGHFEERYGEGAVELDALEALYPGEIGRLVREAVAPYRDETLYERLEEARREAEEEVESAWDEAMSVYGDKVGKIEAEVKAIMTQYGPEIKELQERGQRLETAIGASLKRLEKRLQSVGQDISTRAGELQDEVALPERPEPEPDGEDESAWLFDSDRDYMEQLTHYKARKNGESEEVA